MEYMEFKVQVTVQLTTEDAEAMHQDTSMAARERGVDTQRIMKERIKGSVLRSLRNDGHRVTG